MHDNRDCVPADALLHLIKITYVAAFEEIARIAEALFDIRKVGQVACIGQFVKVHDGSLEFRVAHDTSYEVGADEARAAGHKDGCGCKGK